MKKRFVRHNFNMVEIMLAVIVIALGIAGTFVLFPVGVNANKDATAENSIADIALYTEAVIRSRVLENSNNRTGFLQSQVSQHFASPPSPTETEPAIVEAADIYDESTWIAAIRSSGGPKTLRRRNGVPGVYLYRQLSGNPSSPVVDFSAIVRVYLDGGNTLNSNNSLDNEYFFRGRTNPERYSTMSSNVNIFKFLLPVVMEISWPATVPYEEREKRYFRFEIFNTLYDVTQDSSL